MIGAGVCVGGGGDVSINNIIIASIAKGVPIYSKRACPRPHQSVLTFSGINQSLKTCVV